MYNKYFKETKKGNSIFRLSSTPYQMEHYKVLEYIANDLFNRYIDTSLHITIELGVKNQAYLYVYTKSYTAVIKYYRMVNGLQVDIIRKKRDNKRQYDLLKEMESYIYKKFYLYI